MVLRRRHRRLAVVGAAVGIRVSPERRWQAALLSVGGGSLVVSLPFELFDPAVGQLGKFVASEYFLAGVVTFGTLDIAIDRWADDGTEERGLGLRASVTTDGIPESAAMGSVLVGSVSGALALLFGLSVTNTSQSMLSGTNVTENHGDLRTMVAWVVTAVVVGGSVLFGYHVLSALPHNWVAAGEGLNGGAILASLAGEIYPDAYQEAGPYVTLAAAAGFLGTFLL